MTIAGTGEKKLENNQKTPSMDVCNEQDEVRTKGKKRKHTANKMQSHGS